MTLVKMSFWQRLFGAKPQEDSRAAARERLRGALVGDRSSVAPNLLPALEGDLKGVLARYFDFEQRNIKLALGEREGTMHFSVQLPVRQVHRQAQLPQEAFAKAKDKERRVPRTQQRGPRRKGENGSGEGMSPAPSGE